MSRLHNGRDLNELPEGLPPSDEQPADERPWIAEEIRDMMQIEPKTGAELVEEQRRKHRECNR